MKRYARIIAINAGVFALIAALALAALKALDRYCFPGGPQTRTSSTGLTVADEDLGFKSKPATSARVRASSGGKTIYDVVYTSDGFGRRVVPASVPGNGRDAVLVFGCSFAFGVGLNDRETMPSFLAAEMPGRAVYNYAVAGYGTQQMLAKLESGALKNEIREPGPVLVYVFVGDHVRRNIGGMMFTAGWGRNAPYYVMDGGGRLRRKGSFATGRRFMTGLYETVAGIGFVRHWFASRSLDHPALRDRHFLFTARMIRQARDEFRKQFTGGEFYVALYPGTDFARRLIPLLDREGITYFDYSGLNMFNMDDHKIPGDGHPNARASREFAHLLALDLRQRMQ